MHRKVAGAIVAALAIALGAAGCGGSDKPLTKAEFVRQVNAACTPKGSSPASRARGPEGFLVNVLTQQRKVVSGLAGIKAPSELDSDFTVLKKAMDDRTAIIAKALDAVKADPKTKLERFGKEAEGIQKQLRTSATALGVKHCA